MSYVLRLEVPVVRLACPPTLLPHLPLKAVCVVKLSCKFKLRNEYWCNNRLCREQDERVLIDFFLHFCRLVDRT
jgi:hypothetical protein